ncbi:putative oxidoreductase C-terminal domain-containing protein [Parabacteroides sp. Marseille-P3160]|uniref:putative oxidoreductase C-terminal domain-containing protein n=1 Tax=Parabacteroides sp. Marseille-P3160 TaxID=1917887 RepID=UPI0009B9481F|nr:putative oxidoreductase C-terminal domain-containing protein [Parabacteroides sp. Marseille-P3160]
MRILLFLPFLLLSACYSPSDRRSGESDKIRLITVAPAHFHAALLQKQALAQLDTNVYVYAPEGAELAAHLDLIQSYNERREEPTHWNEIVYQGADFFEKMLKDKPGEVVVLAGNNQHKSFYILESVKNKLNVLADKPMAIDAASFGQLEEAFAVAARNNVLLYDIMTERYDLLNRINRSLINDKELFGELQKGSPDNPAVQMESVHHFFKTVSGKPLVRPAWYYDVKQQGEGIVDVTTHLIDLIHWSCFPGQILDYRKEIRVLDACHWPTRISRADFQKSTLLDNFPDFLSEYVKDSLLNVYANGSFEYEVKGTYVKVAVAWNFEAPEGSGDTFHSVIKGTKATTCVLQGKEQGPVPRLYIRKAKEVKQEDFRRQLEHFLQKEDAPSLSLQEHEDGLIEIVIPQEIREGHETHFSQVAEKYFGFLKGESMPEWEVPNMLAKYFITTQALMLAKEKADCVREQHNFVSLPAEKH